MAKNRTETAYGARPVADASKNALDKATIEGQKHIMARTCMLVSLCVSTWTARRQDKKMGSAAADSVGAQHDRARAIKYLIDPDALKDVQAAGRVIRDTSHYFTLPWLDDGARVIKSTAYFQYVKELHPLIDAFEDEVKKLSLRYPALAAEGKLALGGAVIETEYPVDIRDRFGVSIQFLPFPDATDFRVDGLNGAAEEIKRSIAQVEETVREAARVEIVDRVRYVAEEYVSRLESYQRTLHGSKARGDQRNLSDDIVDDARELQALLPMLNVGEDSFVHDLGGRLAALARPDIEMLVESAAARERAIVESQAILDTMAQFV